MSAVQLMTGSGGWPMTMFLTPDLRAVLRRHLLPAGRPLGAPRHDAAHPRGGAHLPRTARRRDGAGGADHARGRRHDRRPARGGGGASHAWRSVGRARASTYARVGRSRPRGSTWPRSTRSGAASAARRSFRRARGSRLLLRYHRRTGDPDVPVAVRTTLDRMALGGLYDQVGGGFARYSTDDRWLVPHFEKMLYDNALLVSTYAEALRALGDDAAGTWRRVIAETLEFAERELSDPAGGFYSSLDADSEGVEGKFYVWTLDDVREALGEDDAAFFAEAYAFEPHGNWEHGLNIPWRPQGPATPEEEARLKPAARPPAGRPRHAHPPRHGRQGAGGLERAHDLRALPRGAGAGRAALRGARRALRRLPAEGDDDRRPPAAQLAARPRAPGRLQRGLRVRGRRARRPVRDDLRSALARGRHGPGRHRPQALPRRGAGGLLPHRRRCRDAAAPAAQRLRRRHALGQLRAGRNTAAPGARCAVAPTSARRPSARWPRSPGA